MRLTVLLLLLVLVSPVAAQEGGQLARIILTDGKVLDAEIIHENTIRVFVKHDDTKEWIERRDIKEIALRPPCAMTLEQSPELRGFRLGQSVQDVRKRFPHNKDLLNPASFDEPLTARITMADMEAKEEFRGLLGMKLGFLDGKLILLESYYYKLADWTLADFKDTVADAMKLQRARWKALHSEGMMLQCDGFKVRVMVVDSGTAIRLERDGISEEIKQRMDAVNTELKKMFKP
jgi:hypothetical protein